MDTVKLDRLLNQLNISPVAAKDKQLYQVISQLIITLRDNSNELDGAINGVSNIVNNIVINGKNNGLTIPLFDGVQRFDDYADNPYPSLTAGVSSTIINNNTSNITNQNLLATGVESYGLDSYADDPYPSLGTALPITVPVAGNPTITDDNATNATMYPVWVTANSGALPLKVSSTGITWNPSTDVFTAPIYNGRYLNFIPNTGEASSFIGNFNNDVNVIIKNSLNDTNATSSLTLPNDFGLIASLKVASSGYSFVAAFSPVIANGVALVGLGGGGLSLGAVHSTGIMHFFTGGSAAANERMTILANGNVGIGITTPASDYFGAGSTAGFLALAGTANAFIKFERTAATTQKWEFGITTGGLFQFVNTKAGVVPTITFDTAGNVGIGTTGPTANLHVYGTSSAGSLIQGIIENTTATGYSNFTQIAGTTAILLRALGQSFSSSGYNQASGGLLYVGGAGGFSFVGDHASAVFRFYTGGTTLRATLQTTGSWTWNAYGAGAITADASGNLTSVSDERFKDRISNLNYGLNEILQLCPVKYGYNELSKLERNHLYGGFIAQDVQKIMPLAVGINSQGYLTLSDRPILGAVVTAIQQLTVRLIELENKCQNNLH